MKIVRFVLGAYGAGVCATVATLATREGRKQLGFFLSEVNVNYPIAPRKMLIDSTAYMAMCPLTFPLAVTVMNKSRKEKRHARRHRREVVEMLDNQGS